MFGERLHALRTEHKYSMDYLAEIYNKKYNGKLNKSTLSRYENGLQEPMLFVVNNLADLFSVSVDYLIGKEENPLACKRVASVAQRMNEALNIRNMKQADLVRITGIGKSSISTYLSGEYDPKQKNIYKIAAALDVNEAWLMGYDAPMEKEKPTPVSEGGPSDEAMKVARAYDQADPKDQRTVRVILDIEDEYSIGLVARGGKTVTPTRTARKSVIDQLVRESAAEADKENERL